MLFVIASGFPAQVAAWQGYYSLAGGAAAGLLGLLFVAMSLRADPTGREFEFERRIWALGAGVLAMFADVVLIALVFQVPDHTALGVGLPVLILGVLAFLIDLVATLRGRTVISSARWLMATPLVGCALQVVAGVGILVDDAAWLGALAVAAGILLTTALLASWLLLSEPPLAALRGSAQPARNTQTTRPPGS